MDKTFKDSYFYNCRHHWQVVNYTKKDTELLNISTTELERLGILKKEKRTNK